MGRGFEEQRRPKVLVVEDQADDRMLLCDALDFWGYQALPAAGFDEAIQLALQAQPEVALVEVFLPDREGWELAEGLRRLPVPPRAMAVITALDGPEVVTRSRELGFAMHFLKPLPLAALREWLTRVCEPGARGIGAGEAVQSSSSRRAARSGSSPSAISTNSTPIR